MEGKKISSFISRELCFAILILFANGLRFLMRNYQKKWMILIWDIVILRLLIPVHFTLNIKRDLGIFGYWMTNKEDILTQNNDWYWMEKGIKAISLTLVFCYCVLAFYSYFKLLSKKRVCYSEMIRKWGIQNEFAIFESQDVHLACVCGIWNPVILYSSSLETKGDLGLLILEHEKNHIFHYDVLRKHMVQLLTCFHWYNPAFWILTRRVIEDIEIVCDEAVIEKYGNSFRTEYAKLLLSTVKIKKNGTYFNKNFIKERIEYVIKGKKKSRLVCFGILAAIFVTGISWLKLAAYENPTHFRQNHIVYETEWNEEGTHYHYVEMIAYLENQNLDEEESPILDEVQETEGFSSEDYQKKIKAIFEDE